MQHNCCAWIWGLVPGDPSKKLNPELVKDDYERFKIIRKTKIDKKIWCQYYSKKERATKTNILFGPFCLNIKICEKLNMSSPKPNFVDVSNQVGRKSIIWQYLWQDKESENSECQLCKEKGISKMLFTKSTTKTGVYLHSSSNTFIKLQYCWNY